MGARVQASAALGHPPWAACLHSMPRALPWAPQLPWLPCELTVPLRSAADLQVWWEGDQTFYSGILALYDAVSTE